jgi:predicted nucleotide-binding protein
MSGVLVLQAAKKEVEVPHSFPNGRSLSPATGDWVVIVHGRDAARMHESARLIHGLTGYEPTILKEQVNRGLTLIEKFESFASETAFAVVLATADDFGRLKGASEECERARQNVIFELGFFVASLGRKRVAVLHDSDVELPSDIAGLVTIRIDDAGAWKMLLAKELDAAGVDVDFSRA